MLVGWEEKRVKWCSLRRVMRVQIAAQGLARRPPSAHRSVHFKQGLQRGVGEAVFGVGLKERSFGSGLHSGADARYASSCSLEPLPFSN